MPATEKSTAAQSPVLFRIEDDPRWSAVQRILASRNFSRSGRLSAFLVYICRCTLESRSEEITEQQIGMHVFNRPADYNPGDDNIVRTTARQLRQRLAIYYQEEGGEDDIRIEVPKGGYHPIFVSSGKNRSPFDAPPVEIEPKAVFPPQPEEASPEAAAPHHWSTPMLCVALLCGICLALVGEHVVRRIGANPSGTLPLWSTLFASSRPLVFVSGDAGLNMYNNLARTQVALGDYASGAYLSTPAAQAPTGYTWASLASRRYVSWVDLTLADQLRQVFFRRGAQYSVRFARDIRPEDLRNVNLILVGSPAYDPWVEMFDDRLNFHIHYDGQRNLVSVRNNMPQRGEPAEYQPAGEDSTHRGYTHGFGYIAAVNNLEGNGRVLLVEGSTVAGVDASLSFLMNDEKFGPILRQASQHGSPGSFEVLLAADFLKSSSPNAQILATRFYPVGDRSQVAAR